MIVDCGLRIADLRRRGFTMVEIAFSLAIVAFALVAIMGVLPTGMTVQRDNREDTIINQDASYWIEAMRSGSRGIDDLTNYVEAITISNRTDGVKTWVNTFAPNSQIYSGEQIVGLLSTPKYRLSNDFTVVTARVRAINGPASEKGDPLNDFTFRYELRSEVTPELRPSNLRVAGELAEDIENLRTNLQHFRLTLRWPLYQQGTNWLPGGSKRTARALMNGRIDFLTNAQNEAIYLMQPNSYSYAR